MSGSRQVYLDYAAATPVDPRVFAAFRPYLSENFGNPTSSHGAGTIAATAVAAARKSIARHIGAKPNEIVFTGSGTESINLAIQGVVDAQRKPGHIITTQIEHLAVLNIMPALERRGWEVTYLAPDRQGIISPRAVAAALRPTTRLVSVGYVNNEIGVIQPIAQIGAIVRKYGVLFHSDACQAPLLMLDVRKLNVDLLTLNGAKMYAPKGIAILYVRNGVTLVAQTFGGGQEFGLRSGTPNVPGIVGMAAGLNFMQRGRTAELQRLRATEQRFFKGLRRIFPGLKLNGHPTKRLPGLFNVCFLRQDADRLLQQLSKRGIYVSRGAACLLGKDHDSHVLTAMRLTPTQRQRSLRFSLGRHTTTADVDYVLKVIAKIT